MHNMVSEATPATPEQVQHIVEMIQGYVPLIVEKNLETFDGAVRFVDNGPEVGNDVRDFLRGLVQKYGRANQYASEEVISTYVYPPEYRGPKPIVEQIQKLATELGLNPESALAYATNLPDFKSFIPEDALPFVGWFAFPRATAISVVLAKIAATRSFYNYRANQMDRFRVHARTAMAIEQLATQQGGNGDILVAALQLGMRHRGRSTRRAREVFVRNEFGATSVIGGSVTLTHPERFVRWEQLHMDCPGHEFDDPDSDVRFDLAPFFDFNDGEVKFDASTVDVASVRYGSASGFVPQK
jgi:hypothetical protein